MSRVLAALRGGRGSPGVARLATTRPGTISPAGRLGSGGRSESVWVRMIQPLPSGRNATDYSAVILHWQINSHFRFLGMDDLHIPGWGSYQSSRGGTPRPGPIPSERGRRSARVHSAGWSRRARSRPWPRGSSSRRRQGPPGPSKTLRRAWYLRDIRANPVILPARRPRNVGVSACLRQPARSWLHKRRSGQGCAPTLGFHHCSINCGIRY